MKNKENIVSYAEKDGFIGNVRYWKFKDVYVFYNHEDGTITELENLKDVSLLDDHTYETIYEKKNVFQGDERGKQYGILHDIRLDVLCDQISFPNGLWSLEFCRELSMRKAFVVFREKMLSLGIHHPHDVTGKHKDIAFGILVGTGSVYENTFKEMLSEKIEENEIISIFQKYLDLPIEWKNCSCSSWETYCFNSKLIPNPSPSSIPKRNELLKKALVEECYKKACEKNLTIYQCLKEVCLFTDKCFKIIHLSQQIIELCAYDNDTKRIKEETKNIDGYKERKECMEVLIKILDEESNKFQPVESYMVNYLSTNSIN